MTSVWQSHVDAPLESYPDDDEKVVEGEVKAQISILRESEHAGVGIVSGVWTAEPSTLRTVFEAHETVHVLAGRAVVETGGERVELNPGSTASFLAGAEATWVILEPYRQFFVVVAVPDHG